MVRKCAFLASAALLVAWSDAALAQETSAEVTAGNEIIVTATKRETTIQNIPFSINAQTPEDIRRSGATNIEEISRNVAGLAIQNLGPGQSQVSIRGVSAGQIARDQPGVKEQVGVYLDESVISLSLFTPDLDLYDLARVETLRGPQGTLFGSGSIGGTLRYITMQPRLGRTEGSVEANANAVSGGSMGGSIKGAVNVPLGEKAALRAVGYATHFPGFIDAFTPNGLVRNVNDGYRYGGRLAVLFEPSDTVSITPRLVYQKLQTNGFNRQDVFNIYANPNMTSPTFLGKRQQYLVNREKFSDETLIADLTLKVDLGGVELNAVSSYTDRKILVVRDFTPTTGSVLSDIGVPIGSIRTPSLLLDRTKVKAFTQELRLNSVTDGPLQWVAGGFYSHTKRNYGQSLPTVGLDSLVDTALGEGTSASLSNGFDTTNSAYESFLPFKLRQVAAFGEATWQLGDFKATGGLRYYDFKESRQFLSGGLFSSLDNRNEQTTSNGVTPRVTLSYAASTNITFNAQAAKGFRLGGVNDPLSLPLCSPSDAKIFGSYQRFGDESLWNYEVGFKSRGRGFTFNVAGFYSDIKNLQTTLDAGTCSSRVVFNVPKAHSKGIEFELKASPVKNIDLGVSGTIVDARFDSTVTDGTGAVIQGIRDGNRLASVPRFQISGSATYNYPVSSDAKGYLTATVQHVGSRFTQPGDQENNPRTFVSRVPFGGASGQVPTTVNLELPAYQLVNLSAGIEFDRGLSVSVYANNLFDINPLLAFDRERGGRARVGYIVGTPRTIGLTARQTF